MRIWHFEFKPMNKSKKSNLIISGINLEDINLRGIYSIEIKILKNRKRKLKSRIRVLNCRLIKEKALLYFKQVINVKSKIM